MSRLLWMAVGALGMAYYNRIKQEGRTPPLQESIADMVERMSSRVGERGQTAAARMREKRKADTRFKPGMASTAYGAGTASLEPLDKPMASTMYSAGTASLPFDQQAIRDDKVR